MNLKRPLVIDLSAWEKDVFWDRQATDPPLLMITRLTLGKSYTDFMATSHVSGARSIGSKVGVYHFLEFNDIQGQIDIFLNACRERGYLVNGQWTLDVPPVLDVEKTPNGMSLMFGKMPNPKRGQIPPWDIQPMDERRSLFSFMASDPEGDSWAYQIKVWLDAVELATGQRPWIYTSQNYWKYTFSRDGKPPAWTNNYPLWAAWYPDNPDLHEWLPPSTIPAGWTECHLWQYSASGTLPMCPYDGIDMNKASDKLLAELGQPTPPPPTGGSMYKYKIMPIGSLVNIRADHSTTSADIGDLLNGHYAEGDVIYQSADLSQKWLNIATLDGQPKAGWCAVFYNGQTLCNLTENVVTPPPPTGLPVIDVNITLKADGYPDKTIVDTWNPL